MAKEVRKKTTAEVSTQDDSSQGSTRDQKKGVIKKHQTHAKDTGSPQVQVAILTQKIQNLTDHLKTHKKDVHSRKGLIGMVGKRRKLLRYLQMRDVTAYSSITRALHIRK